FVYRKQPRNLRYDANLRAAIALARGTYCFLLGNDDALARPTALADVQRAIAAAARPGVVLTNYVEVVSGRPMRRVPRTGVLGQGPAAAIAHYRSLSFVSGVVL